MGRMMAGLVALLVGAVGLCALPAESPAQGRVVVPIIVNPRAPAAAGATDTRIIVQPGASVAGIGRPPAAPSAGASVPAVSQEVRINTQPGTSLPPNVSGGSNETRVTVEQVPGSAGLSSPQPSRGFGSVPSYTRETQVTVERNGGNGAPGTRQQIQIFTSGDVETPLVITPE